MTAFKTVCFYNNGTIDHRAFTMLGLSAKSSDDAIGFFGTGFKYAIASLLRMGYSLEVLVRHDAASIDKYKFFTRTGQFRNKDFDFIHCLKTNTELETEVEMEMPFTTHLGSKWKLWQAYRELFTNAVDEKGGVCLLNDNDPMPGDICVVVHDHGEELINVYNNHGTYFLKKPTLAETRNMRAVEHMGNDIVYYKTMYTGTQLGKPALFTYDYKRTTELTEDRTIAYTWAIGGDIYNVWLNGMSHEMLLEYLPKAAKQQYYECGMTDDGSTPSEAFIKACEQLVHQHRPLPMWARDAYIKTLPFDQQVTAHMMTKYQKAQLTRAIDIMHSHGLNIDTECILVCVSLPNDVVGYYRGGHIFLSKEVFTGGFTRLLGTLYEEYIHMTLNVDDMTRKMQNAIIDQVAVLLEQVYEIEACDDEQTPAQVMAALQLSDDEWDALPRSVCRKLCGVRGS